MAAVMAPFSEALGALVLIPLNIHDHKVAKEWIKELIEEVIAPSSERSIKRHVESVLGWNRSDSTESRIRDVPDQLRQEVGVHVPIESSYPLCRHVITSVFGSMRLYIGRERQTSI